MPLIKLLFDLLVGIIIFLLLLLVTKLIDLMWISLLNDSFISGLFSNEIKESLITYMDYFEIFMLFINSLLIIMFYISSIMVYIKFKNIKDEK